MNPQVLRTVKLPVDGDVDVPASTRITHTSNNQGWDGLVLWEVQLEPVEDFVTVPVLTSDIVLLHLRGPVHLRHKLDGHAYQGFSSPGGLCLSPHLASTAWWWDRPATVLHIYLLPSLMSRVADEISHIDPAHIDLQGRFNFRDPLLHQLALALVAEMYTDGLAGRLYAESVAHTFSLHLLRTCSSLATTRPLATGRLTPQQLRHATDYINDRLDQSIALADLAAAAGLSPCHFAHQFKQTMGVAPHQYLIQCRVERAKALLLEGNLTIAEVAARMGFADQSHLTRHFKRLLGVPPKTVLLNGKNVQKLDKNLQDSSA